MSAGFRPAAMHGLGTDEANLIRVLATKTNTQMIALNREYSRRFGDKGNLVTWIGGTPQTLACAFLWGRDAEIAAGSISPTRLRCLRCTVAALWLRPDDTSGDVKRVLTAMAKDEAAADADALKTAMKSVATSSDVLTDILCNRSLAEIDRIKAVFKRTNEEKGDLAKWVAADTSGDLRSILLALCMRPAARLARSGPPLTPAARFYAVHPARPSGPRRLFGATPPRRFDRARPKRERARPPVHQLSPRRPL